MMETLCVFGALILMGIISWGPWLVLAWLFNKVMNS